MTAAVPICCRTCRTWSDFPASLVGKDAPCPRCGFTLRVHPPVPTRPAAKSVVPLSLPGPTSKPNPAKWFLLAVGLACLVGAAVVAKNVAAENAYETRLADNQFKLSVSLSQLGGGRPEWRAAEQHGYTLAYFLAGVGVFAVGVGFVVPGRFTSS